MSKCKQLCLIILLLVLTACSQALGMQHAAQDSARLAKIGNAAAKAPVTVSAAAELLEAIAPYTHVILKPGTYNFSALTEQDIARSSGYVDQEALRHGCLAVHNASGLILEAEKNGSVRLITENGYADVMSLALCDGAVLKGLILGHEIEKGSCDSYVLKLSSSGNIRIEDCGLFGCGTYGIWARNSVGLNVVDSDIYECTEGIFSLSDTKDVVFDHCRFYDNDGLFSLWGKAEVLVKNTEIFNNRNGLLETHGSEYGAGGAHITFRDCSFRNNLGVAALNDSSAASFVNCKLTLADKTGYQTLLARYHKILADPHAAVANDEGEQSVLNAARDMQEWNENPSEALGYVIQDMSGDGIPELVIGFMPDSSILQLAVYTLKDGKPQLVFSDKSGALSYSGNGQFHYVITLPAGMGQGIAGFSKDGTQFVWKEYYFSSQDALNGDNVTIYHNTNGSNNHAESEMTGWTKDDFYAWEPKHENLPMIPFSAG
jgi:hypothetical protein